MADADGHSGAHKVYDEIREISYSSSVSTHVPYIDGRSSCCSIAEDSMSQAAEEEEPRKFTEETSRDVTVILKVAVCPGFATVTCTTEDGNVLMTQSVSLSAPASQLREVIATRLKVAIDHLKLRLGQWSLSPSDDTTALGVLLDLRSPDNFAKTLQNALRRKNAVNKLKALEQARKPLFLFDPDVDPIDGVAVVKELKLGYEFKVEQVRGRSLARVGFQVERHDDTRHVDIENITVKVLDVPSPGSNFQLEYQGAHGGWAPVGCGSALLWSLNCKKLTADTVNLRLTLPTLAVGRTFRVELFENTFG